MRRPLRGLRLVKVMSAMALVGAVIPALTVPPPLVAQEGPRSPDVVCAVPEPSPTPAPRSPGLDDVHRIATGAGVRVAVIDTGVAAHPQLREVVPAGDLVTPDSPDPLVDCDGHGTVVAGVIAARETGIAPDATLISVRQSSAHYRSPGDGDGNGAGAVSGTLAGLAEALHLALDAGAGVLNVSVVSCVPADVAARLDTGALDGALARAEAEGAVVVAAAGNRGQTCAPGAVVYPAHMPTVLSVAALDPDSPHALAGYSLPAGHPAPESAAGPTSGVAALGEVPVGLSPDGAGWASGMRRAGSAEVVPFTGTSFAAPVVAGSVALLKQRHPRDSAAELRERVTGAAEPGHGVVDPHRVLTHLAADFEVPARGLAVSAPTGRSDRARGTATGVIGALGALVLAGVLGAGVLRRGSRPELRDH